MRRIDVYSRQQAIQLTADDGTAVISISAPGEPAPLREGWNEILRLEFHDTDPLAEGGSDMVAFGETHVDAVFAFAERNRDRDIVVHCDAGVSRSVAMGLFLSNEFGGELFTHAVHTTDFANGHVLRLLNRRVWFSHFDSTLERRS